MTATHYRIRATALQHDGKHYAEGCVVMLDPDAAARLARWLEPLDNSTNACAIALNDNTTSATARW